MIDAWVAFCGFSMLTLYVCIASHSAYRPPARNLLQSPHRRFLSGSAKK